MNAMTAEKLSLDQNIIGVEIKDLTTHGDQRGFFREVIRVSDPFFSEASNFGQWSHSRMQKDVVKAWHYHHIQIDWWYIASGEVLTVLYDNRNESPTYGNKLTIAMGDGRSADKSVRQVCVKIPPGVLHGCRVISESADLFYITSEIYNPAEEGRIPYNAPEIPHTWGDGAIVAQNDTKYFIPATTRKLIA